MRLPALSAEEQAFLASARDESAVLGHLSERVRGRLTACLGVPVRIAAASALSSASADRRSHPQISPDPQMLHAWLSARFGGHARAPGSLGAERLCDPLVEKLRHALAESVVNLGDAVVWPAGVRLEMRIQELGGAVDYLYAPQCLMQWARVELERAR